MEVKNYFNKDYTKVIKGIAILLVMFHHLFYVNIEIPTININTIWWRHIIMFLSKVGVSIFFILSGYGLHRSFESNNSIKNLYYKLIKLLLRFQLIYIVVYIYIKVIIKPVKEPFKLLDFFGFSSIAFPDTLNVSWWFMEAILLCYILFPLFVKTIKHFKIVLPLLSIPAIYLYIYPNTNTNNEIYFIYIFYIGILFAKYNIFNKLIDTIKLNKRFKLYLIILFIMLSMLRFYIGINIDIVYATVIILICAIFICPYKKISYIFNIFGFLSFEIFLTHSHILNDPTTGSIIRIPTTPISQFLILCFFSIICASIMHLYLKLISKIPFIKKIL